MIVICGDPRTLLATVQVAPLMLGGDRVFHVNMGNAAQIVHLAAAALGLGSQWRSVNPYWEGRLKALLNIPDEFRVYTVVPIGFPAYKPAPSYRREISEIMHSEKYDRSKYRSHKQVVEFISRIRQMTTPTYAPTFSKINNK